MISVRSVAVVAVLLLFFIQQILASAGDQSQFFQNCLRICVLENCTKCEYFIIPK